MQCLDIETLVQTYLDGELADEDATAFDDHIAACEACGEQVAEQARFHQALRVQLAPPAAPDGLREQIVVGLDRADWQARSDRRRSPLSWLLPGAASLAAAAALLLVVLSTQQSSEQPTAQRSLASYDDAVRQHVRRPPIEVKGTNVSPWLQRYVSPVVQVPRFSNRSIRLRGARLSHLHGRDAAQLYYETQVDNRRYNVSALILDASNLDFRDGNLYLVGGRELWVGQSRGYNVVAHKDEQGIGYVFISEMPDEDLVDMVANSDLILRTREDFRNRQR